jgi:hypothetical protein
MLMNGQVGVGDVEAEDGILNVAAEPITEYGKE